MPDPRPVALVTGASSGIGLELVRQFAANGFDLVLAADRELVDARSAVESEGAAVIDAVECDLATEQGVAELYGRLQGRRVDALAANAGIGLGGAFLDQTLTDAMKVVDTNIKGTIALIHAVGGDMRSAGQGRILITSSIASKIPGTFQAVYNGSKAFLQSFSFALRNELKDSGVTVTALLPGATETDFFERAELTDTKVGAPDAKRDDAGMVAKAGFEALMKGEGDVVAGFKNKMQVAATRVLPEAQLAEMHRGMAEPGSAN
ncbi:MAG: SDR family NAD(P)-dependent oxidoreductase [Caulobacteraceae bacterium]|nr:SDR family NAD(P)-dependent oxidoreductase [Caulobacter sp.]